jgi:hypothetical protein
MGKLYFNGAQQIVFRSDDDQSGNPDVRKIKASQIANLVASGASVDPSAEQDYEQPVDEADPVTAEGATLPTDAPAATESDSRLPPSDEQPSTTQTFVTDPASGQTVVQTDSQNPVQPEAPIAVPVVTQGSAEEQAAIQHAAILQRASEIGATAVVTSTGETGVVIAPDQHAAAKDQFAGVMAKIHALEGEGIDELRNTLRAIGTLLHLHSQASHDAEHTGDYKAGDTQ